tara:strand:- start:189 stop:614 length:426 start_codon:yes stop_codon:yes gene_type:complete
METLSINIIKMRDSFLKKYSDLSLVNLSFKLKELLEKETDEIKRIVILASRVEAIRKRIAEITSVLPVKQVITGNNEQIRTESNNENSGEKSKNQKIDNWIKVIIKESTEVNGVRFPEGIKIDVTKEDSKRLIESGKAELV